jgi:hypothetical protein
MALFMGHPEIDWTYRHIVNGEEFSISTAELIEALEDRELLRTTDVGLWIRDLISESMAELRTRAANFADMINNDPRLRSS